MLPPPRHIALQRAGRLAAARQFLTARSGLILCALFLLAGLVLAGDYGIFFDEPIQRHIAQANLNYLLGQADSVAGGLYRPSDRAYGIAFELPLLLLEQALDGSDYYYVHRLRATLTHLFYILGGYFCWRLAYRLFGSRPIAILALLFYLLHPRIYAHAFFNSKDPVFLSMFVIALYLLERAFRRDTLGAFILLGIAVGLLTNLRIMGLALLAAPLAMRGLDWWQAGAGPERKHIRRTAGLFILTAGLTLYAVTPYAWTNPVDYLAANLGQTVNHPNIALQLFQGQLLFSNELPPHYAVTWFGITTPPLIMLLAGLGAAAVAVSVGRRPRAAFRNTRRRLQLLLLAGGLLPLLAVAALGSTQYGGWRQLFFIYAPCCLLAAMGLNWLTAALARQRRRWQAGMYGLTGLGLGLILLQMAQIHPLQQIYFNFLVDRTTPEYLRTQYDLDYWQLAWREGLRQLAERHPDGTVTVRTRRPQLATLPPAARERLQPATGGRRADYDLIHQPDSGQADLAFNAPYRRRLYNNTLLALRPLDSSRMTPAAVAAYREIHRQAVAAEPIIRADYDVYWQDRRLVFVRENCPPGGRDEWFGVKPLPAAPESLPPYSRQALFYAPYHNTRVRLGQLCLAVIQLPADIQGDLLLTRRTLGNAAPAAAPLWEELYSLSPPGLRELIADHRAAAFAVFPYRDAAGRQVLIYAKSDCAQSEYETPIFLHIAPLRLADLPDYRQGSGFDNRDFPLDVYGGRPGGECVAVVPLPDYPIKTIRTGQYIPGQGELWSTELAVE